MSLAVREGHTQSGVFPPRFHLGSILRTCWTETAKDTPSVSVAEPDHDADDCARLVEQRAPGVARIDGGLRLNRRRTPQDSIRILPLIVRSNLRHDALAEGPEVVLRVTDREHILAGWGKLAVTLDPAC